MGQGPIYPLPYRFAPPVSLSIGARSVHRAAPLANTRLTRPAWPGTCPSRVQVSDVWRQAYGVGENFQKPIILQLWNACDVRGCER